MILLADNDYVLKLCACDLLPDALSLLDVSAQATYVLPTAKFKIGHDRGGRLRQKYGAGVDRALAYIGTAREITASPHFGELDQLREAGDPATGASIDEGGGNPAYPFKRHTGFSASDRRQALPPGTGWEPGMRRHPCPPYGARRLH